MAGTPRYMSPGQFRNQPATAKSDIFAMGLVLYEAATGLYPFPPGSVFEILHSIATMEVKAPSIANPCDLADECRRQFLHRLNGSSTREYLPTWSRDGHWVYYSALKEGHDRLLKQNPETGEVVEVSDRTFTDAREDRDRRVLYMQGSDNQLWKLPLSGGTPALVPGAEGENVSRYWTLTGNEIYLTRAENRSYVLKKI